MTQNEIKICRTYLEKTNDNKRLHGYRLLMKLLDRETPKIIRFGDDKGRPRISCGVCKCNLTSSFVYCPRCGQKIHWAEIEQL